MNTVPYWKLYRALSIYLCKIKYKAVLNSMLKEIWIDNFSKCLRKIKIQQFLIAYIYKVIKQYYIIKNITSLSHFYYKWSKTICYKNFIFLIT